LPEPRHLQAGAGGSNQPTQFVIACPMPARQKRRQILSFYLWKQIRQPPSRKPSPHGE